jgi:excinuclease ABC subunit A
MYKLRDRIVLEKNKKHDIEILVDEIFISEFSARATLAQRDSARERLSESLERAIHEAEGLIRVEYPKSASARVPLAAGSANTDESLMSVKFMCPYDGFSYPEIEPRLFSFNSPYGACPECNGIGTKFFGGTEPCPVCEGKRLRPEALNVFLETPKVKINVVDLTSLSVEEAYDFFASLKLSNKDREVGKAVLKEIEDRLTFLLNVGLEYLALSRTANTLSGGEAQRIRLASQLGSRW